MTARHTFAVATMVLVAAVPASASILSASGQAVQPRPADRLDYLNVTAVQNELNKSLQEMADASAASGALSAPTPSVGSDGGFYVQIDGGGGVPPSGGGSGEIGGVFGGAGGQGEEWLPVGGGTAGRGGSNALGGPGSHGGRNRGGGRGGAHAAPEPSTWMLLGAGLAVFGGYAALRRRRPGWN